MLLLLLGAMALADSARTVPEADQQAVRSLLRQLYEAYESKDVDRVMALIQPAVDASAAADPGGRSQEIKDAFRAFHEDLLTHPDFRLEPYNDKFLQFELEGEGVHVVSPVPIILSDALIFKESDGTPTPPINLRLGDFTFARGPDGQMRIVEMNL